MNAIINNVKDPSWWFSAVFVAIIASIFAGFLKERLEKWLGITFSIWKNKRLQNEEARARIIEALLADPLYLQIALYRALKAVILFGVMTTIYVGAAFLSTSTSPFGWKLMILFVGGLNVVITYRTSKLISIVGDTIRTYRKRNNLPKLPH